MVVANNEIDATKNAGNSKKISTTMRMRQTAERCGAHHPMKHIQGFTLSQWVPPSGKCLHRIAAATTMVNNFE